MYLCEVRKALVYLFFIAAVPALAQDPGFSQFYSNPLNLNPAFAGSNRNARVGANYRNQWPRIPGKWVTYDAFGDIYSPFLMGGVGFIAMQDIAGEANLTTSSFGFVQSFERPIPKFVRIRAGYNISVVSKKIDFSRLTFYDQLDPYKGNVYNTKAQPTAAKTYVDFNAGFILDFKRLRIGNTQVGNSFGMSFNHITQPDQSLSGGMRAPIPLKQTMHYTMLISIGADHPTERSLYISPNIIYEKQNEFRTFNTGVYITQDPYVAGVFFRKKTVPDFKDSDALILYVGLKADVNKTTEMKIGYSYDLTISGLATNTMGAHELSLIFEWKDAKLRGKKAKRRNGKRVDDCMDFDSKTIIF